MTSATDSPGVARFLAIESCGQCTPCKTDGVELASLLSRLARSHATASDLDVIERRIRTVDYGARCYLATQQATVLTSIFNRFQDELRAHLHAEVPPAEPVLVAELLDIRDGTAIVDARHRLKQPDWGYATRSSGSTPVELRSRYRSGHARPRRRNASESSSAVVVPGLSQTRGRSRLNS